MAVSSFTSFASTSNFFISHSPIIPSLIPSKSALFFPPKTTSIHFSSVDLPHHCLNSNPKYDIIASASGMSPGKVEELLPPSLDSTSDPPPIFDGSTRLYISYTCPYAQRAWITRNCKGLQDKIKLVPIDLKNKPAWYKEKVYPPNKVPSLEHNNEVKGESLDLIKFIDSSFEGPSLLPDDPPKKVFAEVLFSYTDSFHKAVAASFKEDVVNAETNATFDYMEDALSKFNDGPFLLGQFSLVDIAYAPFFERYHPFLLEVKNFDLTTGRPRLAAWIQEMDNIEGYKQTKTDPKVLVESYKKRFATTV